MIVLPEPVAFLWDKANELKNLAPDLPDVVKDLKGRIDEWLASTPPVREPNPKPKRGKGGGAKAGKSTAKPGAAKGNPARNG